VEMEKATTERAIGLVSVNPGGLERAERSNANAQFTSTTSALDFNP